ncbi:MAG TPA: D-alanyl-D-alanine carboxypeptidase/D-alanyl-D-alanine-endopeptidase [Thermoanaerobaculia bacterium]|jgi:D-alanyl-D-alanine carboxypeptidase/D-alanyl-D-alanine-endopeptidase (penicillin-binding protein 4)|nr:D-alanyl-D-alanine carboxypeptidase/D-alanyl-D-alanine-endopeptidase [Thermoanaerobaculia bacterium]
MEHKLLTAAAALVLSLGTAGAQAPSGLRAALERAARKAPAPPSGVSIAIAEEPGDGPILYGINAGEPLTIASVSKTFSTAAALAGLGKDYQFKTILYRSGAVANGLLSGSLLVVGGGDPNLSGRFYDNDIHAVFDRWADGLRAAGITRVSGDLLLNASFFDDEYRNPGWPAGQEARWYEAPVSALSFNDNCVSVSVRPGSRPGAPAAVRFEPSTKFVKAVSSAKTVSAGRRKAARVAVARRAGSNVVTIAGTVPFSFGGWSTVIAIDDPPRYFGTVLKERLAEDGITVDGDVRLTSTRADATWATVATTTSDILPSIAVANKRSQSFYAEQIFKTLAAEKGRIGSWPEAVRLEKAFLGSLGLDPTRYDLHDGSGLNPQNRVAALDIVRFLKAMAASPLADDWVQTLAISGDGSGTLRHRFRDHAVRGRVYAKTGSLDRVNSLAGYATAASGRSYVFAIVLNGRRVNDGTGHAYEDRILRALLVNG